jgi:hypothetical protein
VFWDLGTGSTLSKGSGSWAAGSQIGLTGGTKLIETSGATFYLTGVQVETGTTATPFERRHYGQELALCQRYFETMPPGARIYMGINSNSAFSGFSNGNVLFKVDKRATPTVTFATTGNLGSAISSSSATDVTTFGFVVQGNAQSNEAFRISVFTASAEL